jgi:hypothetical protein
MGGPDMAPHTPQRSDRPGEAGVLLDTPQRSDRPGQAGAVLDTLAVSDSALAHPLDRAVVLATAPAATTPTPYGARCGGPAMGAALVLARDQEVADDGDQDHADEHEGPEGRERHVEASYVRPDVLAGVVLRWSFARTSAMVRELYARAFIHRRKS